MTQMRRARLKVYLSIALVSLAAGISEVSAQDMDSAARFFQDKTLSIYAAGSVAGPAEIRGRTLSPYLRKYLPGSPNIIVQALPGAGGNRAANNLFNVLPKDGTAIGLLQSTIAFNQAIAMSGIQYDAAKFAYIGSLDPSGQSIMVSAATPVRSIKDAQQREVMLGSSGIGSSSWIVPAMANRFLGTKFRIITGYTGMSDILLAIERKELDGLAINWHSVSTSRPEWRPGDNIFAIAQSGLKRDPILPDAPTLIELAHNDTQRQVVEFYALSTALGVALVAPPGVPAERIKALRVAIDRTFADPAFLADAKTQELNILPRPASELESVVRRTLATPPHVVSQMRDLLNMN
jgi:tripartite-type tricarboxylate transporter receptor subunit TctC